MCYIYNSASNGSLENDSCQRTNGQIYINGIITSENVGEYIPMGKTLCISYRHPLLMQERKV